MGVAAAIAAAVIAAYIQHGIHGFKHRRVTFHILKPFHQLISMMRQNL
jgi:hypothetical protein